LANLYLSRTTYVPDGTTKVFPVSFPVNTELSSVEVTLDGVAVTSGFTFDSSSSSVIFTAAPVGSILVLSRNTNLSNAVTNFNNVSCLNEDDLNLAIQQVLHNQQELADKATLLREQALRVPDTDLRIGIIPNKTARSNKLMGFDVSGEPRVASAEDFFNSQVLNNIKEETATSATNAANSASQAATSATNAANSASQAASSATQAAASASQAATSATNAANSASQAASNLTTLDSKLHHPCCGRLTLTSGDPEGNTSVTAGTTLYYSPYNGNDLALYDGTKWINYTFGELPLVLTGLVANTLFDVFAYNNAGTPTLSVTAWSSATVRATELIRQDGVLVKSGGTGYRYLGTIRTTATAGTCADSKYQRFVWNYYNRINTQGVTYNTNASWTYASSTFREYNGGTGQVRFEWVNGFPSYITIINNCRSNSGSDNASYTGIFLNVTTGTVASLVLTDTLYGFMMTNSSGLPNLKTFGAGLTAIGYNFATQLEAINANSTALTSYGLMYNGIILLQK